MSAPNPPVELRDISDTALWVAGYRAIESERPDALFRDPFAARLAGERGAELRRSVSRGKLPDWPLVMRTVLIDRILLDRIAAGARRVLNLAAGLDSRPYRLPLPPTLEWVEVDLPAMIEHKRSILRDDRPVCALERVALDLADRPARRALLERLAADGKTTLVLTEGLLVYLEASAVAALATDLGGAPGFRWWIVDPASPGLLRMMQKNVGAAVARAGAPFRFAPEEGPEYFSAFGWRPIRVEPLFREAARTKRLPWIYQLLSHLPEPKRWNPKRPWSAICLLENTRDTSTREVGGVAEVGGVGATGASAGTAAAGAALSAERSGR